MQTSNHHTVLQQYVLRTLLYYDIFNYPLKCEEVFRFLGMNSITAGDVAAALNDLEERGKVQRVQDLYCIRAAEANAVRRIKGNITAEGFMGLARSKANFIASFPFVRGVLASGSLSKGYMDEESDLDFFIITAPNRLWIARTLLVMYKRIFLLNSHKFFCVNYFVDENHPQIEERNLFTATELATVIPLYGASQYRDLIRANQWLKLFFPNFSPRAVDKVPSAASKGVKKFMEGIFNVFFPAKLEHYFRKITYDRWERLYKKDYAKDDFDVAFKSREYASKNHPSNYQRKILDLYAERLKSFGLTTQASNAVVNCDEKTTL